MFDLYICYNQISYLVASEHAEANRMGPSHIFYAAGRVRPQRRYRRGHTWRLNAGALLLALLASVFFRPARVFLPHHRVGRPARWLAARARRVCLVDDGMDTLRDEPKNVDPRQLAGFGSLITFRDYRVLGRWTDQVPVERVASLDVLLLDDRPPFAADRHDVLIVESPGVASRAPGGLMHLDASRVLYARHNNPNKSGPVPSQYEHIDLAQFSIERTVTAFKGTVVVGETMVMAFCLQLFEHLSGSLVIQLSAAQYDNLRPLHELMRESGAKLLIGKPGQHDASQP